MEVSITVNGQDLELTADQETRIREEASSLHRGSDRLLACRVTVSVLRRRTDGDLIGWTLRMALTVPGGVLPVARRSRPDFHEALADAFAAARRQLEDFGGQGGGDGPPLAGDLPDVVSRAYGPDADGLTTAEGAWGSDQAQRDTSEN